MTFSHDQGPGHAHDLGHDQGLSHGLAHDISHDQALDHVLAPEETNYKILLSDGYAWMVFSGLIRIYRIIYRF